MVKNTKKDEKQRQTNPFSEMEKNVLGFWKENNIFGKSVEKDAPRGDYVFYDGPPFATGTPHYGHIVGSIMKDVVPRYWTMNGYKVERRWGWDCHGLPIENIVEKEMGSKCKKDIEELGIDKFNKSCCSKVLGYVEDWKKVITRLGRWADMDNAYKTMDLDYMESVWWVFKQLYDKDLIYEGYRSMHICPRCETTLSQQEVTEGYRDIKDLSAIAKFELEDTAELSSGYPELSSNDGKVYVLAWTTTPWTLIGNVALAVGEDIEYVLIKLKTPAYAEAAADKQNSKLKNTTQNLKFIVAKERLEIINDEYEILKEFKGKKLIGKRYKSLFDYYSKNDNLENHENGWKIYGADFVTTEEGTGVVHIAPAFGDDDMNLGKKYNLPFIQHVGMDGVIKKEAKEFAGMNVKPSGDHMKTDIEIIKYLAHNNLLFYKEKYEHSYPHCWRCDTPLINYATSSWFVSITKIKDKLLETAKDINWSPAHMKEGRFGKWLEGARDWSISRQRFWASVIPIWRCKGQKTENGCGNIKVVGSVEEIREEFGNPNKLFLVRHGESENNILGLCDALASGKKYHLTEKGKKQCAESAHALKNKKIDIIFSSPQQRTKETAEIISKAVGAKIVFDKRIREVDLGIYDGKPYDEFLKSYTSNNSRMNTGSNGVEGFIDIKKRLQNFINDINENYQGKNIIIVSHGDPLLVLKSILLQEHLDNLKNINYPKKGEYIYFYSKPVDLHKHSVDKITFPCEKCGGEMARVPDVLDCWFESGSMPYAQMHYPFENKEKFDNNFPAKFIAEGVDQTRAWFYYLHAIAGGIKGSRAFDNVIVNGIVLAEDGKKMAKKLNNYPDPMLVFDKYGADALRHYLLTSPVMLAENMNFSEKGARESLRNVVMILWNVVRFYEMYATDEFKTQNSKLKTDNVLDKWILARLNQLVEEVTENMNNYNLPKAARPIGDFISDLSTWYIRRSRDRFKGDDEVDKKSALGTTGYVLLQLSKVMAPFTPFIAESVWQKVAGNDFKDGNKSVHLEEWPALDGGRQTVNGRVLEEMEQVRQIIELGLSGRNELGIKIRQPLSEVRIMNYEPPKEYENLIKDELNVKKIKVNKGGISVHVGLDVNITEELKREGMARELVRFINALRKQAGMTIQDRAVIYYESVETSHGASIVKEVFEKMGKDIMNDTLSDEIINNMDDAEEKKEVKINGEKAVLGIKKI